MFSHQYRSAPTITPPTTARHVLCSVRRPKPDLPLEHPSLWLPTRHLPLRCGKPASGRLQIPAHQLPRSSRDLRTSMPSSRMPPLLHIRLTSSPETALCCLPTPCSPFAIKNSSLSSAPCPAQSGVDFALYTTGGPPSVSSQGRCSSKHVPPLASSHAAALCYEPLSLTSIYYISLAGDVFDEMTLGKLQFSGFAVESLASAGLQILPTLGNR
jgi:hypothetical protein